MILWVIDTAHVTSVTFIVYHSIVSLHGHVMFDSITLRYGTFSYQVTLSYPHLRLPS